MLAGYDLSEPNPTFIADEQARLAAMQDGHRDLVAMTCQDYGFDLILWRRYLIAYGEAHGYTHPYAFKSVDKAIERAIATAESNQGGTSMSRTKPITYLKGDATAPGTIGNKIICHVCNDIGGWGKGFVVAISKKWPQPEAAYRAWYRDRNDNDFALGGVQLVQVEPELWVANMIGQHGIKREGSKPPIRYEAIEVALKQVAEEAMTHSANIHMPRIGCGLAGGTWDKIEPIILRTLCDKGIEVFVYDFV